MEKYTSDKKFPIMTRNEVRDFDSWAINELGIPGVVLMENAGRSCAELIKEKLTAVPGARICIFCGKGNNGGDGYVIARHLLNSGFEVITVLCGQRKQICGDAKTNLDILEQIYKPVKEIDIETCDIPSTVKSFTSDCKMIVDALFGTGLKGELKTGYKQLIDYINAQLIPTFAVDIPSGLDCDTGEPLDAAIKAECTVTFAAMKKGFVSNVHAHQYTGQIYIASIGIEPPVKNSDLNC
ncbi:MAG: NAD(P)H-hydrate epimerase [Planctomycetota bacterium]|jgi:NAD(P)H-hydrate epimerase